jgi:hypothetical protein
LCCPQYRRFEGTILEGKRIERRAGAPRPLDWTQADSWSFDTQERHQKADVRKTKHSRYEPSGDGLFLCFLSELGREGCATSPMSGRPPLSGQVASECPEQNLSFAAAGRECSDPTIRYQIEEMAKQWGHSAVTTEAHENEVHKPRLV